MVRSLHVLVMVLAAATNVALADNEPAPHPCVECHGLDGLAAKPGIPHLNGQFLGYLADSMARFRGGSRPGRAFGHDPAGIDDARLMEVLKHYSEAKAVRPRSDRIDAQMVARGETVYRDRCADCHPDNGRESDKDAPLMAAQDVDYLIKQIHHFGEGKRKFVFMMDKAFQGLADADLEAAAHFFASQEQVAPPRAKKRRR